MSYGRDVPLESCISLEEIAMKIFSTQDRSSIMAFILDIENRVCDVEFTESLYDHLGRILKDNEDPSSAEW